MVRWPYVLLLAPAIACTCCDKQLFSVEYINMDGSLCLRTSSKARGKRVLCTRVVDCICRRGIREQVLFIHLNEALTWAGG